MKRCQWTGDDFLMKQYHDKEWGVPIYDDDKWFEYIVLESFQAGLSWKTILHKREGFRKAFFNFNVVKVSNMNEKDLLKLKENRGIIRNWLKIKSTVSNAKAFIKIQQEHKSFNNYIWSFTDNNIINNKVKNISQLNSKSELSDTISKDLKNKGFKFMGSTICYALLQASGVINDHSSDCFRYKEI